MKENVSPLPAGCSEKKFSPLKLQTLQIPFNILFHRYFQRWYLFHRNYHWSMWQIEQWNKKLVTCRRWVVRTRIRQLLFCKKIRWMRWKNIFHAKNRKSHKKFTAFTAFNAKSCGCFAVKTVLFHGYSPLVLLYFFTKPRPGKPVVR